MILLSAGNIPATADIHWCKRTAYIKNNCNSRDSNGVILLHAKNPNFKIT